MHLTERSLDCSLLEERFAFRLDKDGCVPLGKNSLLCA